MDVQTAGVPTSEIGWSWAPYAPWETVDVDRYALREWAPASTVRHPWVRLGRWTLLYRRAA